MDAEYPAKCFGGKLLVLDKAHSLFVDVNRAVHHIRRPELYDLKRQLLKSSLSMATNIAEGRHKKSEREFLRFLDIARGSTGELQYQLKAATDTGAIPAKEVIPLSARADEVAKMLRGLIRRIEDDLNDEYAPDE